MNNTKEISNVLPYDNDRTGYKKETILKIKGTYHKLAVCSVREGEEGRRVFKGPLVEGPWASTFGLSTSIVSHDNSAELDDEASRTIEVESGDLIEVDGTVYEVSVYRKEYIKLINH